MRGCRRFGHNSFTRLGGDTTRALGLRAAHQQVERAMVDLNTAFVKYYQLGNLSEAISSHDSITCSALRGSKVVLGTEHGWLHVCDVSTGQILHTIRAHESTIVRVSVDDSVTVIGGCCRDGSVFVLSSEEGATAVGATKGSGMEMVKLAMQEKGSTVWVGRVGASRASTTTGAAAKGASSSPSSSSSSSVSKGEVMVLVGTQSGALVQRTNSWYKDREQVLYSGATTPVEAISLRGDLVAWADADQVRVMDLKTRQPLCYLSQLAPPSGADPRMLRCTLLWETQGDLLVGWGRNFKHLRVNLDNLTTRVKVDCLIEGDICGVVPRGEKHVVVLVQGRPHGGLLHWANTNGTESFMSPLTPDPGEKRVGAPSSMSPFPSSAATKSGSGGDGAGGDVQGEVHLMIVDRYTGAVRLVDKVASVPHADMKVKVSMDILPHASFRAFVVIGSELVVGQGSNYDDCISAALRVSDYGSAANYARRGSELGLLRKFTLWDIVALHIMTLLDRGESAAAASECARLLGPDVMSWAHWIMIFIERDEIAHLAPHVPSEPRLDSTVYELILEHFLNTKRPRAFRTCLRRWLFHPAEKTTRESLTSVTGIEDRLFEYRVICKKLEQLLVEPPKDVSLKSQAIFQECRAMLVMSLNRPADAVNAYLDAAQLMYEADADGGVTPRMECAFTQAVLALIQTYDLYAQTSERIADLAAMSPRVATEFLPEHLAYYSLGATVRQLRNRRFLLHLYLHTIFTTRKEYYNKEEYASYHMLQIPLYVEFTRQSRHAALARSGTRAVVLPDLVVFLKGSKHAPMELALEECKFHRPPLFLEIAYIYASTHRCRAAVEILLQKCHDVSEAVRFVEIFGPPDLLTYISDHCVSRGGGAVAELLDCLAERSVMKALPSIVRRLPSTLKVPHLARRLGSLMETWRQAEVNERVLHSLHTRDVDALHRRRASGAVGRVAMRVVHTLCCEYCGEAVTRSQDNNAEARAVMFYPGQRAHHVLCHKRKLEESKVQLALRLSDS